MKIRDLLKIKGRPLVTIGPDDDISAAVQKLVEYDRGSLAVCNKKGELVGIVTERDIVRKCVTRINSCASLKIRDVMTSEVAIGIPDDDLDYAVSVMRQKRVRHLPIVENDKVVGMVSMRDLLDVELNETRAEIRYAGLLPKRPPRRAI